MSKKDEAVTLEKESYDKDGSKISGRNNYIDMLKGIAIISVVLIHTSFHSGNSYVPKEFANFTILFEVPMFFFLAGWSYSYSKSNKNYIKGMIITQIKYMIFMTMIYIGIEISNCLKLSDNPVTIGTLMNWFLHTYPNARPFTGVSHSLWFFRNYFFVSLLGAGIITLVKPNIRKYIISLCFIGIILVTFKFSSIGKINIGIELSSAMFYLFFYMLGYHVKDKTMSLKVFISLFVATILAIFTISKTTDFNVLQIESNKFPPNFIFMLWSLFGVYIAIFLKKFFGKCKPNIISKIGQNSIYVFLAQGVGSSVLFWIVDHVNISQWYFKILVMFGINLAVTTIVTIILKLIFDPLGRWLKKFLEEKVYNKEIQ